MKSSWSRALALSSVLLASMSLSCGSKQELVSITITPHSSSFNLTGLGQHLSTQFTAVGSYIHPPSTRDITSSVIWTTDSPDIITLSASHPGLITTTGLACGTDIGLSANAYSNPSNPGAGSVISAQATVNVAIPACTP
jgi:hypothetical protein